MADADYSDEIWKDIPGWEGLYQASSVGRIKSLERYVEGVDRIGRRFSRTYPEKVLALHSVGIGYRVACLSRDGKSGNAYVHRLVCLAFHGSPVAESLCAAHWDGDVQNNTPGNLRWATYAENTADKVRHKRDRSRSEFRKVKITPAKARAMAKMRHAGFTNGLIAELFSVSASTVQKYIERQPGYVRRR